MATLELRLFGVPRLFVDGEEVVISRPRVFECLARVIIIGPDGISRKELARKIWPNHEESDARSQLRGTLLKLRLELEKVSICQLFDLSGETLKCRSSINSDFTTFLNCPQKGFSFISQAAQPFVRGWDQENWREESFQLADRLASALESVSQRKGEAILELIRKGVQSHPTSVRLVTLLVRNLESSNRIDEANQTIIRFEESWLDAYGSVDMPRLSLQVPPASEASFLKPWRAAQSPVVWGISLSGGLLCAVLLGRLNGSPLGKPQQPADIIVTSKHLQRPHGKLMMVIGINSEGRGIVGLRHLSDGEVVITSTGLESQREDIVNPRSGLVEAGLNAPGRLRDRVAGESLVSVSPQKVVFTDGQHSINFAGTPKLPNCDGVSILGPDTILETKTSADPFRDHLETFIANSGKESQIQPMGGQPQVLAPTFVDGKNIFVSYSRGVSERWRYHAGKFNLVDGKFRQLPFSNVAYQTERKTLVTLPETTTVKNGDFDTHWNGRVMLVKPGHAPTVVSARGQVTFESVSFFGDTLILQTFHDSASKWVKILPIDGIRPPINLPKRIGDIFVSSDGKALIYRAFERDRVSNSYVLWVLD